MALLSFVGQYINTKYYIHFVNNVFKVTVEQTSIKISDDIVIFCYSFYFLSLYRLYQYKDCCYRSA